MVLAERRTTEEIEATEGKPKHQKARFELREWGIIFGFLTVGFGCATWFLGVKIEEHVRPVAQEVTLHKVESAAVKTADDARHAVHETQIKDLKTTTSNLDDRSRKMDKNIVRIGERLNVRNLDKEE